MRPKTSVRQPIIAGARREHLSELLRKWRRQPRKRSLLLFWLLLSAALVSDTLFLYLGVRLVGVGQGTLPPPADRHIHVPFAADSALWEPVRRWVIRADGRTRLFESFSREAVRKITGEERFEGRDPVAMVVSWMLDNETNALKWDEYPFLLCEDAELRDVLYREGKSPARMSREEQLQGRYVEPSVVSSSEGFGKILRGVRTKRSGAGEIPQSLLERHAVELQDRLTRFEEVRNGAADGGSSPDMQSASAALFETYRKGGKDCFAAALNDYLDASRRAMQIETNAAETRRLSWEAWLNDQAPARKATCWSLLGLAFFTLAAVARTRRPRWRRWLLLSGSLAGLGCLGWASAAIVSHAGAASLSDGTQGMLWAAALVLGLSLFLALLRRDAFLAWAGTLASSAGFLLANYGAPALPDGVAGDSGFRVQALLLLSGCAALALAWTIAALALGRILLALPTGEWVRRLATLCVGPIRIGVVLLTASALLDGWRALTLGSSWRGWSAQALGTLFVLPLCAGLLHARRRGWIQPFAFLAWVGFGFMLLALLGHGAVGHEIGRQPLSMALADAGWFLVAGLLNLSLAAHAALRFYYGKQPILEA